MTRAAILAALLALPAHADVAYMAADRMSLQPAHGDCFAVVEIVNRAGTYNRVDTLDTEHGPVSISYRTVGGHQPGDDDMIAVQELPDNVLAVPMDMALPDGETGHICLIHWVGM